MFKLLTVLICACSFISLSGQSPATQDTIDNNYWSAMMKDRTINFYQTKRAYDLYFSNKPKVKGTGWKIFERWAERAEHNISFSGRFLPMNRIEAEIKKFKSNNLNNRGANSPWKNLGPFNQPEKYSTGLQPKLGRIADIAFHPKDSNVLYMGAPSGGFWISKDKGKSWKTHSDLIPNFGVSSIAVINKESNTPKIIVGTGDRDGGDVGGKGIYKTLDEGVSFTKVTTIGDLTINELIVNSKNSKTILAATSTGIYRSTDEGENWNNLKIGSITEDIKYNPEDTSIVYAVSKDSFFRSTDGGNSWSLVTSGFSAKPRERMAIGVTKANPNIVYLIASEGGSGTNAGGLEALYKSTDKGLTFNLVLDGSVNNLFSYLPDNSVPGGQAWFNIAIEVSPSDPNTIYVGGTNLYKSTEGGLNFNCIGDWIGLETAGNFGNPDIHADVHYLGINPITDELYIGNDGGLHSTADGGVSYVNLSTGMAITQFYRLGLTNQNINKFICGAQDNGTSIGYSGEKWKGVFSGDGFKCAISPFDTTLLFGSLPFGRITRSTNNGNTYEYFGGSAITEEGAWVTPFELSPRIKNLFVSLQTNPWVSRNAAASSPSFQKIGSGITATGSAIRFSNANDSLIFFGWRGGKIGYCSNLLSPNPSITYCTSIDTAVSIRDIETSYTDDKVLYICAGTKILKSVDKGINWLDISGNLPSVPLHTIVIDKYGDEALYVGTESGVYFKNAQMSSWIAYNTDLSSIAPIYELEIAYDTSCKEFSKLYAATYGRGLWVNYVYTDNPPLGVTLSKNGPICRGDSIVVSLTGADNYSAVLGENWTKSGNNKFILNPTAESIYTFRGKSNLGKCFESTPIKINVNPNPTVSVNPNSINVTKGNTVSLSAAGASSYLWTPNKYFVSGNNKQTVNVKPDSSIDYLVKGTDSNGCFHTIKVSIIVKANSTIHIGAHDIVQVYPNPSLGIFNLQLNENKAYPYTIFDIEGRELQRGVIDKINSTIDLSNFKDGVYVLTIDQSKIKLIKMQK